MQFRGIGRTCGIVVFVLAMAGLLGGCYPFIVMPIPTFDQGEGLSEGQVHEQLASGQFTREDVLLTFGPPLWHMEADRYFVYRWDRTHWSEGIFFIIFPIPGTFVVHALAPQYLAIEFNPNGELLRYKYFYRWKASRDDEFFDKIFPVWVNESRSDSH